MRIVEGSWLEILLRSEVLCSTQVLKGLDEGALTAALNGEHVGTIIHKA